MGYLVLQSNDDKTFDVIDGQQRLTTISLIVLAILKNIQNLINAGNDADSNKRRMDQIRQTYVGYLDPVTLVAPKIDAKSQQQQLFSDLPGSTRALAAERFSRLRTLVAQSL